MDVNKPASGISKCPISKGKELTFGIAARLMGLVNMRPTLQKIWATYDVDEIYKSYIQNKPNRILDDPDERALFVKYALSRISIYTTREFLKTPIDIERRFVNSEQIQKDGVELKERIYKICNDSIDIIFKQYMDMIRDLITAEEKDTEEKKLIHILNRDEKKELLEFSTMSGTLPTIDATCANFQEILQINDILDIDSFIGAILTDKTLSSRALSNKPSIVMYFSEKYPRKFWFFRQTRSEKVHSEFMRYGFPMLRFDTSTLRYTTEYTADEFEQRANMTLKNHPQLKNQGYSGCPLLYEKEGGINLIIALHKKIAEFLFAKILESCDTSKN